MACLRDDEDYQLVDCEETYAGTPCLGCTTAALKISELQMQVEALKQQAQAEAIHAEVRMSIFRAIKDAVEVALK